MLPFNPLASMRNNLNRWVACIAIGSCLLAPFALRAEAATDAPRSGLYFDPLHSGHGLDLQRIGQQWTMVFYTYDSAGQPEWMLGVLEEAEPGLLVGELAVFDYQADRFPRQQAVRTAGTVQIDYRDSCAANQSTSMSFVWELDGESATWCVQSLLDKSSPPPQDYTGLWFAGPEDAGWGLSLDFERRTEGDVEVQVLFYYDDQGAARWALGSGAGGPDATILLDNFRGYCRTCEPEPLSAVAAGEISHQLQVERGFPKGQVEMTMRYALGAGNWNRGLSPLVPLSDPQPGLIPVPERIEPDEILAITNINIVPMTDPDLVLEHQTLVVADGLIQAIGEYGAVAIPEGAIRIDGSGLFMGPGLHDMHTHFTFGGQIPMLEAGTLFVANGVTTVLNMGDSGTQNLPGTNNIFANGSRIGPRVLAGAAAYGTSDNRAANLTVSTPGQATVFAEQAQADGYQFLKLYNGLSPSVVSQFIQEGERLGMPVNGHIPKTMTMAASLDAGQDMIAHVAEIYFTLFQNQPNDDLLPQAAALMLEHGVFLTDTLTASESFAANFGGNEAAFAEFASREGVLYQPTSFAENGWRNFFNSSTLQPPGSFPGQLDDRLAYFKKMVRYFSDAGVPVILGTDSPGHIGVISGFSVHENLRIYTEIGLDPFAAYAAASTNPARYISESLQLDVSWGTVVEDQIADLIILENAPLESTSHLKRPYAVITQGRFYSREFLQGALDALDAKYRDPILPKSASSQITEWNHFCLDHAH